MTARRDQRRHSRDMPRGRQSGVGAAMPYPRGDPPAYPASVMGTAYPTMARGSQTACWLRAQPSADLNEQGRSQQKNAIAQGFHRPECPLQRCRFVMFEPFQFVPVWVAASLCLAARPLAMPGGAGLSGVCAFPRARPAVPFVRLDPGAMMERCAPFMLGRIVNDVPASPQRKIVPWTCDPALPGRLGPPATLPCWTHGRRPLQQGRER